MSLSISKPAPRLAAVLLVLLGLSLTPLQAAPLGPATEVVPPEPGLRSERFDPAVSVNAGGASVIVWSRQAVAMQRLEARRFAADGSALGPVFVVDAVDNPDDRKPDVALADDGSFVISWHRGNVNLIRRYAADGQPIGAAVELARADVGQRLGPPVLDGDGSGNHVVAWSRYTETGERSSLLLPAAYDDEVREGIEELLIVHRAADGSLRAPPQVVASQRVLRRTTTVFTPLAGLVYSTQNGYAGYALAVEAGGAAVLAWGSGVDYALRVQVLLSGVVPQSVTENLHARRYGANTAPLGEAVQVSTLTTIGRLPTFRSFPQASIDRSGAATVSWTDVGNVLSLLPLSTSRVYARRIDADGRLRPRASLGTGAAFEAYAPALTAGDDSQTQAIYTEGGSLNLKAILLGSNGQPAGSSAVIGESERVSGAPAVDGLGNGAHVVVWSNDGVLKMRRYGPR